MVTWGQGQAEQRPDGQQQWGAWQPWEQSPAQLCGGVEAWGTGCGDPQSRLGRTEPSATVMRHLSSRLLGLGEMTVTMHVDGSVMFRTSSSKLGCLNVLFYCYSCLSKRWVPSFLLYLIWTVSPVNFREGALCADHNHTSLWLSHMALWDQVPTFFLRVHWALDPMVMAEGPGVHCNPSLMLLSPSCHGTGVSWCFTESWSETEGGSPVWRSPSWRLHEIGPPLLRVKPQSKEAYVRAAFMADGENARLFPGVADQGKPISQWCHAQWRAPPGLSGDPGQSVFYSSLLCRMQESRRGWLLPGDCRWGSESLWVAWCRWSSSRRRAGSRGSGLAILRLLVQTASLRFKPRIGSDNCENSSLAFFPSNSFQNFNFSSF